MPSVKKAKPKLDLSNLPPPSDNLGPSRQNAHKPRPRIRKPAPTLRKPGEDEDAPEGLADEIRNWTSQLQMQDALSAMADLDEKPVGKLAVPPPEDLTRVTAREAARLRELLEELVRRRGESLNLFRPLPVQQAFFECLKNERLFLGGNRSGKTLTCAIEVARIMTGQDPYSKCPKKDGIAILVGKDLNHCGKVMAKKLFRPGQFFLIRDPDTNEMRAFDPANAYDQEHEDLKRPAPPLIPQRLIKFISWENKKEGIIKSFELKNGWVGTFYSSEGDPPQGQAAHLAWFDEEIVGVDFYNEVSMRLIDFDGIFIWSATPQAGTIELYDLYERALSAIEDETEDIAQFQMSMMDNPHLSEKARQKALKKIRDDGEYEVRIEGRFALHGLKIYPEFEQRGMHYLKPFDVPPSWTRYVTVDPGVQVCGVLFCAVPPPKTMISYSYVVDGLVHHGTYSFLPGQVVVYDELYIRRCDAKMFGRELARKCQGIDVYAWAMDNQMGRQTLPTGKTYQQHYEDAVKENGLASHRTKHHFMIGSPDIDGGIEAVRQALRPANDGHPRLLVMADRCPNLCKEFGRYTYIKKPDGEVTDVPTKRRFHLMDCLRYLMKMMPKYKNFKQTVRPTNGSGLAILQAKQERAKLKKQGEGGSYVSLG